MNRIPDSYLRGSLRNITPVCLHSQIVGIGFDMPTGVVRVGLSLADAKVLADVLKAAISAHHANQAPRAEVTIAMRDDGRLLMRAERMGRPNATYADSSDGVLKHIPALLKELREETAGIYPVTLWGEQLTPR